MFQIDDKSNVAIYEQIIWKIKELRLRGVLRPGEKLPSVRELSAMIIANPNTVSKAYQELERQGVIETRQGKGTFMAEAMSNMPDPRYRAAIKEQLQRMVIDAIYAGLSLPEIQSWLQEEFEKLGGGKDA
ncbi:GntR family transcriptional regulator [Clostridiales bacterium PH28_bin88]|nr:GntR family transcriptional regulator [Clostridiales bacterium PH28_bin88]